VDDHGPKLRGVLCHHVPFILQRRLEGGLPPLVDCPDPVYAALIKRVAKRNTVYYARYPQDVGRVREILKYLDSNNVTLPNGGQLTVRRWQQLGVDFGMRGGIDGVHLMYFPRSPMSINAIACLRTRLSSVE